jgi:hypothetical protein
MVMVVPVEEGERHTEEGELLLPLHLHHPGQQQPGVLTGW